MSFKEGDRVTKERVLRTDNAVGVVEKVSNGYVVVKWDGINGHWHYTPQQTKELKHIKD